MRKNEQKKFPSNPRSLSEISTDVSVLILETLRRLGLYTSKTYEPAAQIPFCQDPKIGVMTLVLSHQDKSA